MKLFSESDHEGYLDFWTMTSPDKIQKPAISIDKANRLFAEWLAKGTVVYGTNEVLSDGTLLNPFCTSQNPGWDKHRAILVNVGPIEKDTTENLLREILEEHNRFRDDAGPKVYLSKDLFDRAKALLEKGA